MDMVPSPPDIKASPLADIKASDPSPARESPRDSDGVIPRQGLRVEERDQIRITDDGRERMLSGEATINPFDIADIQAIYCPTRGTGTPEQIAKEIDFEWKRYEVYGEQNHAEWLTNQRQGWRPVQHASFPGRFAPPGTDGIVRVKDMYLAERPMRLTVQARMEEHQKAIRLMQAHRQVMSTAPDGQAPRVILADRTSREDIKIPE